MGAGGAVGVGVGSGPVEPVQGDPAGVVAGDSLARLLVAVGLVARHVVGAAPDEDGEPARAAHRDSHRAMASRAHAARVVAAHVAA